MPATKTNYLVTGANRGIGLAIVKELSSNESNFVIATARTPSKATALNELAAKNANVKVIAYDGTGTETEEDKKRMAEFFNAISGYVIDVLFINHGVARDTVPVTGVKADEIVYHVRVNAISPLQLVNLVKPLMEKSSVKKILFTSSIGSSLGIESKALTLASYGVSKAALNFFMRQFYKELSPQGFKVASVHPGTVKTDMLYDGLKQLGTKVEDLPETMKELTKLGPVLTAEESAHAIITNVVGPLSETKLNGKFVQYDGVVLDF